MMIKVKVVFDKIRRVMLKKNNISYTYDDFRKGNFPYEYNEGYLNFKKDIRNLGR